MVRSKRKLVVSRHRREKESRKKKIIMNMICWTPVYNLRSNIVLERVRQRKESIAHKQASLCVFVLCGV